jgi:hypothetical protein
MSKKYWESDFEFPLWLMIKERAEQKDISYYAAARECIPEYMKTIRYDDEEFEDIAIEKAMKEMGEELGPWQSLVAQSEKRGA